MAFYPDAVQELFLNPLNTGAVEKTAARGDVASFACGAVLRVTLRVETPAYRVAEAKFQANGCGYLIAAASVLTEIIQGLTLAEAEVVARAPELCDATIMKHLVTVPDSRAHCIALCREALADAISNYRQSAWSEWQGVEPFVCVCFGVTEQGIQEAIVQGALETVQEVAEICHAGAGCGSCRPLVQELLDQHWGELP